MLKKRLLFLSLIVSMSGFTAANLSLQSQAATAAQINQETTVALNDFQKKISGASKVLSEAKGILVFPHLYKGAFLLGGQYGEGELLIHHAVQGYYNIGGISYGFQAGGQRQSLIIAFMTDQALQKFRQSEGWDIGADASVAVVKAGKEASVMATEVNKPILVFVVDQRGLMGGASLKGTKITKLKK